MKTRSASVANAFYAGTAAELTEQLSSCFNHKFGPGTIPTAKKRPLERIVGMICPHAGYVYSGPIAATGYDRLALDGIPDTAVILGPNHTGYGSGVAIMTDGGWETPLGVLSIDNVMAKRIHQSSGIIDIDETAHRYEHSIEVQLPFLQFLFGDSIKFVPICMMMQDLQTCRDLARTLVKEMAGKNCVIIASSDFTHYLRHEEAVRKDKTAINAILSLDDSKLNELGESNSVTMCGYGPITTLLAIANSLGNLKPEFLTHKTSGDISGDKSSVVGYASILITR